MSEERRKKDEQILRPLMRPERFEERRNKIDALFERVGGHDAVSSHPAAQGSARVGQHLLRGTFEQRKIGNAIANVGKAVLAKPLFKYGELLVPCEICGIVTAQDTLEDAEMVGYAFR